MGTTMLPQLLHLISFLPLFFGLTVSIPNPLPSQKKALAPPNDPTLPFALKLDFHEKDDYYTTEVSFGPLPTSPTPKTPPKTYPIKIDAARSAIWMSSSACRLFNQTEFGEPCYLHSNFNVPDELIGIPEITKQTAPKPNPLIIFSDNGKEGIMAATQFSVKPIGTPGDEKTIKKMDYGAVYFIEQKHFKRQATGFIGLGMFFGDQINSTTKTENYLTTLKSALNLPAASYLLDHKNDQLIIGADTKFSIPAGTPGTRGCNIDGAQAVNFEWKINGPEMTVDHVRLGSDILNGTNSAKMYVYLTSNPKEEYIKVPQCIYDKLAAAYLGKPCGDQAGLPSLFFDFNGQPSWSLEIPYTSLYNKKDGETGCQIRVEPHEFNVWLLTRPFKDLYCTFVNVESKTFHFGRWSTKTP